MVTFDCYGTLIDWNGGIVGALGAEGERQGREVDAAAVLAAYHAAEPRVQAEGYRSYREILTLLEAEVAAELGWDPPAEPGYLADSLPSWRPFDDTNGALRRLADAGIRLGILSNIDDDLLAGTRRHLDVDFDLIVTAQQVRSYKPAVAHFERALASVAGGRDRLLHAAQSYFHDVRPARELDITTVWVNRLAELVPPDGPAPNADVTDLDAAVDWILSR
ncbi:MAG: HAD-IA family hydrolase [Acidobacteriota bacterium]|jgi:2-haloalkanoic acid dehalogenase type II